MRYAVRKRHGTPQRNNHNPTSTAITHPTHTLVLTKPPIHLCQSQPDMQSQPSLISMQTPSTPSPTLATQLSAFQAEVRSLIVELGAEIRTEQLKQQMKLDQTLGKIDIGQIAIRRLQERVDALGRAIGAQSAQGV